MFNSELDFQINKIEKNYFEKLYREKPDYINIDELSAVINNIFENVSGVLLDPLYENERSKFLYGILNKENRNKIIPIKFQTTDIKNIKYFCKGNNCLLISLDGNSSKRIKVSLMLNKIFRMRVLNLTEELKGQGYELDDWLQPFLFSYKDIYDDAKSYELAIGNNYEEKALYYAKQCFADCFKLRDFYNAKKWLYKCLDVIEKENEKKELEHVWTQVENALQNAETKVKANCKNIINLHWIDNVRYDTLSRMPFVEQQMRDGVFFENMYTITPNTRPTEFAMFGQKTIIDDDARKIKENDILDIGLGSLFKQNGYKFVSNGVYLLRDMNQGNPFWGARGRGDIPSTLIMYYTVCRMEGEGIKDAFMLNHYLFETHPPYISPQYPVGTMASHTGAYNEELVGAIIAGQKYVDEQLRWYNRYFDVADVNIYMSDHGYTLFDDSFYPKNPHHVIFSVVYKNKIYKKVIKKAESLLNFGKILELTFNNHEITEEDVTGYALIQQDDAYGKNLGAGVFRGDLWNFLQYRGVITADDLYVKLVNGEEFYLVGDESANLVNDEMYKDRIEELKLLAGNEFIDIYKDDFYVRTRKFYKKHNIKRGKDILYKSKYK